MSHISELWPCLLYTVTVSFFQMALCFLKMMQTTVSKVTVFAKLVRWWNLGSDRTAGEKVHSPAFLLGGVDKITYKHVPFCHGKMPWKKVMTKSVKHRLSALIQWLEIAIWHKVQPQNNPRTEWASLWLILNKNMIVCWNLWQGCYLKKLYKSNNLV